MNELSINTNLIVPSFTFLDRNNRVFSLVKSKPTLGWFNDYIFEIFQKSKTNLVCRSQSCTHSFIILGKDAKDIALSSSPNFGFGEGTIFDYLYKNEGYWINLGCEPNQGYSLIHQVETINDVPYRELVKFPVKYSSPYIEEQIIHYIYPSRKDGYNTSQRYDRLVSYDKFRITNLYEGERKVSIHKYKKLISIIESLICNDQFFFIEN